MEEWEEDSPEAQMLDNVNTTITRRHRQPRAVRVAHLPSPPPFQPFSHPAPPHPRQLRLPEELLSALPHAPDSETARRDGDGAVPTDALTEDWTGNENPWWNVPLRFFQLFFTEEILQI